MARIPIYQERQQVSQNIGVSRLRAPDVGADAIGRGMAQVGQALGGLAQTMIKVDEENQKNRALEDLVNDEMFEKENLYKRKSDPNLAPGAEGFTKSMLDDFDARYNKKLESMPEGPGKQFYRQNLLRLRGNIFDQAMAFEALEGQKYTINTAAKASQGFAQLAMQDPDPVEIEAKIGQYDAWVDSLGRLSASQKQELKDNNKALIYGAALDGTIMQNPDAFLATAKDNPLLKNIPAEKVDDYINKAKIQSNKIKADFKDKTESWVWGQILAGANPQTIANSPTFKALDPKDQVTLISQMKSFTSQDTGSSVEQLEYYLKLTSDPQKLAALTDDQIKALAPMLGKTLIGQVQRERAKLNDPNNVIEVKLDMDIFKQIANEAGFKPYESRRSQREIEQLATLEINVKNRIDMEQRLLKRPLTPDEKQKLMKLEVDNKVFVDRFGPDKQVPISMVEKDDLGDTYVVVSGREVKLNTIPASSRNAIIRQLRAAGRPVTEQAIAEVFVLSRNLPSAAVEQIPR